MKRFFTALFLSGTMLLFLLFPAASFDGAKTGLLLWFHQVLPSLLPFFILNSLLLRLGLHNTIGNFLYPFLHPLFRCSRPGCFAIVTGMLSGLPLGAKTISELYEKNELSRKEGILLLALCSNPSPMFLISYVGTSQLSLTKRSYLVFLLVLASAVTCHFCVRLLFGGFTFRTRAAHPEQNVSSPLEMISIKQKKAAQNAAPKEEFSFSLLDTCILNGFETICKIGGYIILFNIYAAVLPKLLPCPENSPVHIFFLCMLEMTTGIASVCRTLQNPGLKLLLVTGCAAFGGLSGLAQTAGVLNPSLLCFQKFFLLKLFQCLLSLAVTAGYLFFGGLVNIT